jgi:hypothetical protein
VEISASSGTGVPPVRSFVLVLLLVLALEMNTAQSEDEDENDDEEDWPPDLLQFGELTGETPVPLPRAETSRPFWCILICIAR